MPFPHRAGQTGPLYLSTSLRLYLSTSLPLYLSTSLLCVAGRTRLPLTGHPETATDWQHPVCHAWRGHDLDRVRLACGGVGAASLWRV